MKTTQFTIELESEEEIRQFLHVMSWAQKHADDEVLPYPAGDESDMDTINQAYDMAHDLNKEITDEIL